MTLEDQGRTRENGGKLCEGGMPAEGEEELGGHEGEGGKRRMTLEDQGEAEEEEEAMGITL